MNILRFELKKKFLSFILWTIALVAIGLVFMALFPSFTKDMEAVKSLLANYPKEILHYLGMDSPDVLSSVYGFYGLIMLFTSIAGSVCSFSLGLTIFAREKIDRTSDFLLSKPVKRETIFLAKLTASLIYLITLCITLALVMYYDCYQFDKTIKLYDFVLIYLALLLVLLVSLGFGILFANVLKKIHSVSKIAIGFAGFNLAISFLQEIFKEDFLNYLSLYKYFPVNKLIDSQGLESIYVIICLITFAICLMLSAYFYKTKDVHTN